MGHPSVWGGLEEAGSRGARIPTHRLRQRLVEWAFRQQMGLYWSQPETPRFKCQYLTSLNAAPCFV